MNISIIVPVLNEADIIAAFLQQLVHEVDGIHEIIVVDGGSEDRSVDIASAHAKVIRSPKGRAAQMNAGAAIATGDVLLFLHADTVLPRSAVSLIGQSIDEKHHWGRFDVRLSGEHVLLRIIERMMNLRSRLTSVATGDQAMFVTRSLFELVGGFDEVPLMEDIALSKRLRKHSRAACLSQCVITSSRRWQQNGIARTVLLMWWLRLQYFLGVSPHRLAQQYYGVQACRKQLVIFARAPVAGQCNTRLAATLGDQAAADLQRDLIMHRMRQFGDLQSCDVVLCCSPDTRHELFRYCGEHYSIELAEQHGDDLGARMADAFRAGLQDHDKVVLIGTDAPVVDPADIEAAFAALDDAEVVIQPAEDGGYVLIAMTRSVEPVFSGIDWGTDRVMQQTSDTLDTSAISWRQLETAWDIDTVEDYQRYRQQVEAA